ncbi:MAG: hypothetical protein RID91_03555 [Azospirillaceae bacterium]
MDTGNGNSEGKFWAATFRSILSSIDSILGKLGKFIPWLRHWLHRPILVPHQRKHWWHMGRTGDQRPAMQVATYWHITNPTDQPIRVLSAFIARPKTDGMVLVKDVNSNYFGSYSIPPGCTTELNADFWIVPPITKEGRHIVVDVVFIDQFNQRRKVKAVKIASDKRRTPQPTKLETERIWTLTNEIEKRVASVLQDEIARYKKFGRREGQLGSVLAEFNGREIRQIYQDSWSSDKAGQRQEIASGSGDRKVKTENGDALVRYYNGLSDKEERDAFVNALLKRLTRRLEYFCVSYLILYVMFRSGKISDALAVANQTLSERRTWLSIAKEKAFGPSLLESHQRYGYSDFFGMLNGLLRYEHEAFRDSELDDIEKCISEADEHTFRIAEKVNSIRSLRLSQRDGSTPLNE